MKNHNVRLTLMLTLLILAAVVISACGGNSAPAAVADAPASATTAPAVATADPAAADQLTALNLPVNIDAAQANDIRTRSDVVILDVREDWEYAEGHAPDALWIPLGDLPSRLNDIPKDKTVIAFCRSGNRSNQATSFLRDQGFTNVHNMTGGMNAWQQAGYPVEK